MPANAAAQNASRINPRKYTNHLRDTFLSLPIAALLRNAGMPYESRTTPESRSDAATSNCAHDYTNLRQGSFSDLADFFATNRHVVE